MKYIDFGSKYGFDGLLVEGWNTGWDENWCSTGEGENFDFLWQERWDSNPQPSV